jgi:hypothetical protein
VNIIEFVTDAQLLGLSLSPAQETLLRAIYALPMTPEHQALYRLCTGRERLPEEPFGEVTVVAGARAGKDSRIAAPIVAYEALFGGHERNLAKGERGQIVLVAQDLRGTKVAFGYVREYLTGSTLLSAQLADAPLASEIPLANGLTITCFPCTIKSLRGWSVPCAALDELAYFRLEGQADSDAEIQSSVRRGMLTFDTPKLVKISTPYMKSGVVYEDVKAYWGQDSHDILVWRAPSALMNPRLKPERLERLRRLDPDRYAREYEAEFAEGLDAFLPAAWVEGGVVSGRHELPPRAGVRYFAAVDPSGGGPDSFTLAVVHVEVRGPERVVIHDVMRGWRRRGSESIDLQGVVREIAAILRPYGLRTVVGDRYAADWVRQACRAVGVVYQEPQDRSGGYLDRSGAYLEVEPLFAQGRIELLDHPELVRELKNLERRHRPGGKVVVTHPSSGRHHHDDYANALALAAASAMKASGRRPRPELGGVKVEMPDPAGLLRP